MVSHLSGFRNLKSYNIPSRAFCIPSPCLVRGLTSEAECWKLRRSSFCGFFLPSCYLQAENILPSTALLLCRIRMGHVCWYVSRLWCGTALLSVLNWRVCVPFQQKMFVYCIYRPKSSIQGRIFENLRGPETSNSFIVWRRNYFILSNIEAKIDSN